MRIQRIIISLWTGIVVTASSHGLPLNLSDVKVELVIPPSTLISSFPEERAVFSGVDLVRSRTGTLYLLARAVYCDRLTSKSLSRCMCARVPKSISVVDVINAVNGIISKERPFVVASMQAERCSS